MADRTHHGTATANALIRPLTHIAGTRAGVTGQPSSLMGHGISPALPTLPTSTWPTGARACSRRSGRWPSISRGGFYTRCSCTLFADVAKILSYVLSAGRTCCHHRRLMDHRCGSAALPVDRAREGRALHPCRSRHRLGCGFGPLNKSILPATMGLILLLMRCLAPLAAAVAGSSAVDPRQRKPVDVAPYALLVMMLLSARSPMAPSHNVAKYTVGLPAWHDQRILLLPVCWACYCCASSFWPPAARSTRR